jgi:hypothetical protein
MLLKNYQRKNNAKALLVPKLQLWNAYQTPNNKANLM